MTMIDPTPTTEPATTDLVTIAEALRQENIQLRDRVENLRNEVTSLRSHRTNFIDALNTIIQQDEATPEETITWDSLDDVIKYHLGSGSSLKFKRTYDLYVNYTVQAHFSVEAYSEEDAELEFDSSGTTISADFYVPSGDIIWNGWTEEDCEVESVEAQ